MCNVCIMTQTFDPVRHTPDQPIFADLNEDIQTAYMMETGDTYLGTLSSPYDQDWIRVELTAGETYQIMPGDVTPNDLQVQLYDTSGRRVASNDDNRSGLDFIAAATGTYYISVEALSANTGSYALSLLSSVPLPPPGSTGTLEELGTFLQEGTTGFQRTYNTSLSNQITVNLSGLTADGQQLARWAMEAWEMVADIDFVEVSLGEMITVDDEDSGAFAYFPNSGSTYSGVELNVSRAWLNYYGSTIDSYSFQTYVHEFGHALGLRHLGNYDASQGPATYQNNAYFTNDSWQMSVMSYFSQTENTSTNASFAFLSGPMMADIWAIHGLYGAPEANSATAGNTTYGQDSNLGNYMDALFDWLATGNTNANVTGNLMAYTIYDRDGIDTLNFGFLTENARLDLCDAQFSDFGSYIGILGIAQGTVIENAITGSGNDVVTGNAADNIIEGNAGNDSIIGDAGNDQLDGGVGNDSLSGGSNNDTLIGAAGEDTMFGGNGADLLSGGDGADSLNGGNGDDTIDGGAGNDTIVGGNQNDSVTGGLDADEISGGNGNDTLWGGSGDDVISGNGNGDVIKGDNGFDLVNGGAGNDTLSGNNGNDTISGEGGNDRIWGGNNHDLISGGSGYERIFAGNGNDQVYADDGRDRAFLGDGNDTFYDNDQIGYQAADRVFGGAGDDTIHFGGGNDRASGGSGVDAFIFNTAVIESDRINDFEVGIDELYLGRTLWGGANLSVTSVTSIYGDDSSGTVIFDFGSGNIITLSGVGSLAGLLDDISILG